MKKPKKTIVLLILVIFISFGCTVTKSATGEPKGKIQQFMKERIELFTKKHFDMLNEVKVEFLSEDKVKLYVEFTPNFGSIIFKNEVWQWSAAHALNLMKVFPEIIFFEYKVVDKDQGHLMNLIIDDNSLKTLEENFYGNKGPGNSYSNCFTKVIETPRGRSLPLDERFFDGSGLQGY